MSRRFRVYRVGNIRIKLPPEAEVVRDFDLERVFGAGPRRSRRRSDALIVVRCADRELAVIIEETSSPEAKDLDRLYNMPDELRDMGLIQPDHIVVRVLHHSGIKSGLLVRMARSYSVELQGCRTGLVNLDLLFRRRGITPRGRGRC